MDKYSSINNLHDIHIMHKRVISNWTPIVRLLDYLSYIWNTSMKIRRPTGILLVWFANIMRYSQTKVLGPGPIEKADEQRGKIDFLTAPL